MRHRISIRELLLVITAVAIGLAALRSGSDLWLQATAVLTLFLLGAGLLGAVLRTRPHGAWWGFAVFGCGCYYLTFSSYLIPLSRPNTGEILTEKLAVRLHPWPAAPAGLVPLKYPPISFGSSGSAPHDYVREQPLLVANEMKRLSDAEGTPLPPQIAAYIDEYALVGILRTNAVVIAKLLRCLIVAFGGSLLGRFLAARREPLIASPA